MNSKFGLAVILNIIQTKTFTDVDPPWIFEFSTFCLKILICYKTLHNKIYIEFTYSTVPINIIHMQIHDGECQPY